ncbi:VOC family protein [Catelliglobosispora koreensis]|uniref:VOC family protein n=1 Tax=Catelliglobosispora koreensis TaxID=129052 RepID=UPI000377F6E5|nr:VOC family protein [Catelliglobosispora koreensis]
MTSPVTKLRHIKLPVTDLARSASWYTALLTLTPQYEFVEQGELRGVSLIDRATGLIVALRLREFCASRPDLSGYDPVAFAVADRQALQQFYEHCDSLGVEHTDVRDAGPFGTGFDVVDPDRTVLRFICEAEPMLDSFVGVIMDGGVPQLYYEPRLTGNVSGP